MEVTVALCTHNRAETLRRTLGSMRGIGVPGGLAWEVLVVNNACSDATDEVIASFSSFLPVRRLFEPFPGKARAADRATQEARGRLLLWTDDDVRFSRDWLVQHMEGAARNPQADFFGGPIRPCFLAEPPRWLREGLREVELPYAILDLGPQERELRLHERFNGPNLSIRTEVARRFRRNPLLGPKPGARIVGEETALQTEMMRAGHRGWWLPLAAVEHEAPERSLNLRYVAERYRLHGRTVMASLPYGPGRLLTAARSLASILLESWPRYLLARALRREPGRWLRPYRRAHTHMGKLSALRLRLDGAPPP